MHDLISKLFYINKDNTKKKKKAAHLKNFEAINVQNTHDLLSHFCLCLKNSFKLKG